MLPFVNYVIFHFTDPNLHAHLFFWPMTIASGYWNYDNYGEWRLRVIADIICGGLVPCICWVFIRRSYRGSLNRTAE